MALACWERGPPRETWVSGSKRARFRTTRFFQNIPILYMRAVMSRFKLLSGGLMASLMVLVAASAAAQEAGQWTMTGRTYDLQRYSLLTAINKQHVKSPKATWPFTAG